MRQCRIDKESSERLLQQVLSGLHNQETQELTVGHQSKEYFLRSAGPFLSDKNLGKSELANLFKSEFSLRPRYSPPDSNVLGRIHNSVMKMCADEHPEFEAVALCIAKQADFLGKVYSKVYSNDERGVAVVLNLAMFTDLYSINCLYNLINSDLSLTVDQRMRCLVQMCGLISDAFGKGTVAAPKYLPQYRDHTEFMRIHIITSSQQQFVMLHEYGHLATSHGELLSPPAGNTSILPTLEDESNADLWAAQKIARYGAKFYIPWMQLRSLLWLFEFMYFCKAIERVAADAPIMDRTRYDKIKQTIDVEGNILPEETVHTMRESMDMVIDNWELIRDEVLGKEAPK